MAEVLFFILRQETIFSDRILPSCFDSRSTNFCRLDLFPCYFHFHIPWVKIPPCFSFFLHFLCDKRKKRHCLICSAAPAEPDYILMDFYPEYRGTDKSACRRAVCLRFLQSFCPFRAVQWFFLSWFPQFPTNIETWQNHFLKIGKSSV